VKQVADTTVHGEVSANPLNPRASTAFVIRLQDFAGRATPVEITTPVKVRAAVVVNLTEQSGDAGAFLSSVSPIMVKLKPYETLTVRFMIEPAP